MNKYKEYMELSKRTRNQDIEDVTEQASNYAFGLFGETGEVVDLYKKHLYQGHDLNKDKVKEELGDVLWYLFGIIDTYFGKIDQRSIFIQAEFNLKYRTVQESRSQLEAIRISDLMVGVSRCVNSIYDRDLSMSRIVGVLHSIENTAELIDENMNSIMDSNIEKLEKRYDNLKFEVEKSVNREE